MQAVSSVGQSGSCVLLLRDLGAGGNRLPALSPFISSACLKRFSFGCCGCWWFQASSSCLQNVLLSLLPGAQRATAMGLAWLESLPRMVPSPQTCCLLMARPLPKLPPCTGFKLGLSGSFPALPCPLPRLWFPAMQPCLLSAFHGVKQKKLTTWHFFLLLCNLKLNMDLGLPWLVLELPLSYFGTVSHQCSRLPCVWTVSCHGCDSLFTSNSTWITINQWNNLNFRMALLAEPSWNYPGPKSQLAPPTTLCVGTNTGWHSQVLELSDSLYLALRTPT